MQYDIGAVVYHPVFPYGPGTIVDEQPDPFFDRVRNTGPRIGRGRKKRPGIQYLVRFNCRDCWLMEHEIKSQQSGHVKYDREELQGELHGIEERDYYRSLLTKAELHMQGTDEADSYSWEQSHQS